MIRYKDLVEYTKANHVSWDTELFSVLRGFFDQYSPSVPAPQRPCQPTVMRQPEPVQFIPPSDGQYSNEDLMRLFST